MDEANSQPEHGTWPQDGRESTGDAELDALWAMTPSAVDRIANDPSNPLHLKAKQVQGEAAEPVRQLVANLGAPLPSAATPPPWAVPGLSIDWQRAATASPALAHSADAQSSANEEPTMAQLLRVWQQSLEEQRRANEYWQQFIAATEASGERSSQLAREANDISAEANAIAKRSLLIAAIAALVAVVSAIAAILSAAQ
ncbi:hypothetical protein GCM10023190_21890 [Enteractinococcus fodinae]|uniref:Transmembrane protein n=1 Tax=Enteractinococcus fodinae TaxID=684663 RepID=A0ABU2B386_9MICC|nr:hypothetical protein [Enteractinococcus fodinae]MDR7348052.1 hypothetical protein [Enteractinococcus fodinae]